MELINHTALAAELLIGDVGDGPDGRHKRTVCLIAKARFDVSGHTLALSDVPSPILEAPVATADGDIPSDLRVDNGARFEIVVVGAATAPGGRPVERMELSLRVGNTLRKLSVTGDRTWVGTPPEAAISSPEPFVRMPLSWARAYGGEVDAWLDAGASFPVGHRLNRHGRGVDVSKLLVLVPPDLCAQGFPRIDPSPRCLPNLEHPRALIAAWEDDPWPYTWTAMPPDLGLRMAAIAEAAAPPANLEEVSTTDGFATSHSDLRFEQYPAGAPVELIGCSDQPFEFAAPRMRIVGDYQIADRSGSIELLPTQMVLFPSESYFSMSYQYWFKFKVAIEEERSVRLRVEEH